MPEEEYAIDLGVADVRRGRPGLHPRRLVEHGAPGPWRRRSCWRPEGIEVEVIDPPQPGPPSTASAILESVRRTEHVVIVQEAVRRGGVASDMASIIQAEAFDYLDAPVEIVAGRNTPIPFSRGLEQACIPPGGRHPRRAVRRAVYA